MLSQHIVIGIHSCSLPLQLAIRFWGTEAHAFSCHDKRAEVVIGVFCNTAIENAGADKELASIKQVYTKSNQAAVGAGE